MNIFPFTFCLKFTYTCIDSLDLLGVLWLRKWLIETSSLRHVSDLWLYVMPFFFRLQNETECAYYMRTGQCKFGSTCKFHHPQPSNMMVSLRGSPVYPTVPSATTPGQLSYPLSRGSFIPGARWQGPSGYTPLIVPQGVVSVPGFAYGVSFHIIPWKLQLLVFFWFFEKDNFCNCLLCMS